MRMHIFYLRIRIQTTNFDSSGVYVKGTIHISEAAKAIWVKRDSRDTQMGRRRVLPLAGLDTHYRLPAFDLARSFGFITQEPTTLPIHPSALLARYFGSFIDLIQRFPF